MRKKENEMKLKKLYKKICCKLGKHKWIYDSDKNIANRCCRNCNLWIRSIK